MSEVRDEMMKRILSGKIVQAPTACYKAELDGTVSDELIEFYTPRAENPVLDMIIVEHSFVAPRGQASPRQISLATSDVVEGLSRLASQGQRQSRVHSARSCGRYGVSQGYPLGSMGAEQHDHRRSCDWFGRPYSLCRDDQGRY